MSNARQSPSTPSPRYIIEAIAPRQRSRETGLTYRIIDTLTDHRIARCALGEDASLIVEALNAPVSETSTPASDAAQRILQLTKALEQSVRVVRVWHAMPQKPNDADAFDLYFNHSPEMKLIRDALGKMPEET